MMLVRAEIDGHIFKHAQHGGAHFRFGYTLIVSVPKGDGGLSF
jgi:hypothetical protein